MLVIICAFNTLINEVLLLQPVVQQVSKSHALQSIQKHKELCFARFSKVFIICFLHFQNQRMAKESNQLLTRLLPWFLLCVEL